MYRCNKCWKEFENPEKYPWGQGEYWGAPYIQYYSGCPYCKSEDYSEIIGYCDFCNFRICRGDTYYLLPDGSRFCENCITQEEA